MLPRARVSASAWLLAAAILVLAVFYSLALFPGLEWHSAYFGNAYKAIHPGSFLGDPYIRHDTPLARSLYYQLVGAVGEPWLDDRVTMGVYVGLVILALLGVDRTARMLGVTRVRDRLLILGLMAITHRFRDNIALIVTNADFYAGTFAGVVNIWWLAGALGAAPLWQLAALGATVWSLNAKWAWFPTLIVVAVVARERLRPAQQRFALGAALLAGAAGIAAYVLWIRPPGDVHARLFDYLRTLENSEVNPWIDNTTRLANIQYWGLLGAGWLITPRAPRMAAAARLIAMLGALLWLVGGLYISYAPDALKVPYIVPLAFNRATQWPQYLLFLTIAVGSIQRMAESRGWRRIPWWLLLLTLYGTFSPRRIAVCAVVCLAIAMGAWVIDRLRARRRVTGPATWTWDLSAVTAAALIVTSLAVHSRAIWNRRDALRFLARHGIVGDNPSAKWVGVNEYVRAHASAGATILPIAGSDYPWRKGVCYETSLKTRTGRVMPGGSDWAVLFSPGDLARLDREQWHIQHLSLAWKEGNLPVVEQEIAYFRSIGYALDYLIVETTQTAWWPRVPADYRVEAVVGGFTVYRRGQAPALADATQSEERT